MHSAFTLAAAHVEQLFTIGLTLSQCTFIPSTKLVPVTAIVRVPVPVPPTTGSLGGLMLVTVAAGPVIATVIFTVIAAAPLDGVIVSEPVRGLPIVALSNADCTKLK